MEATTTGAEGSGAATRHTGLALALNAAAVIVFGLSAATLDGFTAFIAGQALVISCGLALLALLSLVSERAAHPGRRPVRAALAIGSQVAASAAAIGIGVALNSRLVSSSLTAPIALGLAGLVLAVAAELLQAPDPQTRRRLLIARSLQPLAMVAFFGLLAGGPLAPVALVVLVVLALVVYWRDPRRILGRRQA